MNNLNALKFLIEQADREVKNGWTRSNLLLAINSAALAVLLAGLSKSPPIDDVLAIGVSVVGCIISVAWLQIHRMSRHYADRWLCDAHRLVKKNPELEELCQKSMVKPARPPGPSATKTWYVVIVMFVMSWIGILLYTVLK